MDRKSEYGMMSVVQRRRLGCTCHAHNQPRWYAPFAMQSLVRPMAAALLTTCRRRRYDPRKSFVSPGPGPYDAGGAAVRGAAHSPACIPAGAGGGPFNAIPVAVFCWGTELHYPERS